MSRVFKKFFNFEINENVKKNVSMSNDSIIIMAIIRNFTNKSQDEVYDYMKSNNLIKYESNKSFLSDKQYEKLKKCYLSEVIELNLLEEEIFKKNEVYNMNNFEIPSSLYKDFNISESQINKFIVGFNIND